MEAINAFASFLGFRQMSQYIEISVTSNKHQVGSSHDDGVVKDKNSDTCHLLKTKTFWKMAASQQTANEMNVQSLNTTPTCDDSIQHDHFWVNGIVATIVCSAMLLCFIFMVISEGGGVEEAFYAVLSMFIGLLMVIPSCLTSFFQTQEHVVRNMSEQPHATQVEPTQRGRNRSEPNPNARVQFEDSEPNIALSDDLRDHAAYNKDDIVFTKDTGSAMCVIKTIESSSNGFEYGIVIPPKSNVRHTKPSQIVQHVPPERVIARIQNLTKAYDDANHQMLKLQAQLTIALKQSEIEKDKFKMLEQRFADENRIHTENINKLQRDNDKLRRDLQQKQNDFLNCAEIWKDQPIASNKYKPYEHDSSPSGVMSDRSNECIPNVKLKTFQQSATSVTPTPNEFSDQKQDHVGEVTHKGTDGVETIMTQISEVIEREYDKATPPLPTAEDALLSNIMVVLFLQHPTGVLETELPLFYQQCYNKPFAMSNELKYLLSIHKGIVCTRTIARGTLFTLRSEALPFIVSKFDSQTLCAAVTYHIQKILRCYPNGVSCDCFQQVFHNMVQLRLSKIMPSWFKFVSSIPSIHCLNIRGCGILIQMDESNQLAVKKQREDKQTNEDDDETMTQFLMHTLNENNVLKHCYGYDELLMALFHEHNTNLKAMDGAHMEQLFYKLYKNRLVCEAPFVQSKLQVICEVSKCTSSGAMEYSLSGQYITYMKQNIDGFKTVFKRKLEFRPYDGKSDVRHLIKEDQAITKSPFSADHCTLFMGGFCKGDSSEELERELTEMGVTVVSCSGILYRSYGWAYVTLANAKECDYLLSISPIYVLRRSVDVRPYLDRYKASSKLFNKPSQRQMAGAIRRFINNAKSESLSIAELQSRLFRKYSYRISGPEIIKLVSTHADVFSVCRLPGQPNSPMIFVLK
eukprot:773184_1